MGPLRSWTYILICIWVAPKYTAHQIKQNFWHGCNQTINQMYIQKHRFLPIIFTHRGKIWDGIFKEEMVHLAASISCQFDKSDYTPTGSEWTHKEEERCGHFTTDSRQSSLKCEFVILFNCYEL